MAFLDNSGDIILDAVLTDLGRKRMAEGNFRITQFTLGDDEIDYSLYNKNHPSGSAFYDLEILQTPIFEAFTRENSNINYGLLTFDGNSELFYLPKLALNQKTTNNPNTAVESSGIVYLAVNTETYNTLKDPAKGTLNTNQVILESDTNFFFSFETGIDNSNDPAGTAKDRQDFLINTGLLDNEFSLVCDSRFITSVLPIKRDSVFSFSPDDKPEVSIGLDSKSLAPLGGGPALGGPMSMGGLGQRTYIVPSIDNKVFDQGTNTVAATSLSEINGPRGRLTAFNFGLAGDLKAGTAGSTPSKFTLYGRTAVATSDLPGVGGSETYDILDTIVYVRGTTTGANTQLIVRLIRQAS